MVDDEILLIDLLESTYCRDVLQSTDTLINLLENLPFETALEHFSSYEINQIIDVITNMSDLYANNIDVQHVLNLFEAEINEREQIN